MDVLSWTVDEAFIILILSKIFSYEPAKSKMLFLPQVPPGLTICKNDLGAIAGQFLKLVNYNRDVFGEFYNEIIENHCLFKVEA